MSGVSGRVEVAGIVLARIRDHGPWVQDLESGWWCFYCGVELVEVAQGDQHKDDCLWPDIERATDLPGAAT